MTYKKRYYSWLTNDLIDIETKRELLSLTSNYEIEDRFYKDLEFGTAGMRAVLGAGTNRMNMYTVGKVTQAFSEVLLEDGQNKTVVVSYDVRHMSKEFAEFTATIFAANGIKVYLSEDILATPITSYAIRQLGADAGVIITASHNPPEYNGYKAYGKNGGQIQGDMASAITKKFQDLDYCDIRSVDLEKLLREGRVKYIPEEVYRSYMEDILSKKINDENIDKSMDIVYSPFNGTGNKPVREVLSKRGFSNVHIVEDQEAPDGDFPTLSYPNPEDPESFELAIDLGEKVGGHILLATDPDADRLGLMVKSGQDYTYLTGNELGPLLVNYILEEKSKNGTLPDKTYIIKTIVTGDLTIDIGETYNTRVYQTLTGFKNIASVMDANEESGENFIFAFEESIGYLYGDSIRDKDGISAAMIASEMAAYYKAKGKTLLDILDELYEKYGYYENKSFSIYMKGLNGQARMEKVIQSFRQDPIKEIRGIKLSQTIDYLYDETGLSKSNVLKYYYGDNWLAIRPSGTEPKLKFYMNAKADSKEESKEIIKSLEYAIRERT